jgi:L-lactate dehydrogenase (cytochrome)
MGLVDMDNQPATQMIGESVKMPAAIAPTGFTGMMWADEIHAARLKIWCALSPRP